MTDHSTDSRAVRICERAYETWFSRRGSGDSGIPLSVIASFMLADRIDERVLLASTDEEIVKGMSEVWSMFWLRRPDLCSVCGPLADWVNDDPWQKDIVQAAAAMARSAVKAGICEILRDRHLLDTDLLGHAYMTMRPKSARDARGEFYTPPSVCRLMAEMTFAESGEMEPGMSIAEPAAGTGGMLRAAAEVLRALGKDPQDFWWVCNDISPLVTAALAVNCHVWGLGYRVIVGAADTLAEPDWYIEAWERQRTAVASRDDLIGSVRVLAVLNELERYFDGKDAPELAQLEEHAPPAKLDLILPSDGTLFDMPAAPETVRRGLAQSRRPGPSTANSYEATALF